MGKVEQRDAIDMVLDQTQGAREHIRNGLHKTKVALAGTVGIAGASFMADWKAGLAVGAVGLAVTLYESSETMMPYLDHMEFPNPSAQEVELTEAIPAKIS